MDIKLFDVKVISLSSSAIRRGKISSLMQNSKLDFTFIDAIDGRKISAQEYYPLANNENYKFNRRHIISPSELGCRLSHKKALEQFIENSDARWLIVLEDDVSFKHDIDVLLDKLKYIDGNVLHLGGQEGLNNSYRSIKYKVDSSGLKKVFYWTSRWLYRTCGYIVDKKSASKLLDVHSQYNFVADDWSFIIKKSNLKLYFFDFIRHPEDLNDSSIEHER